MRRILFFAALVSAQIFTTICKAQPGIIYTIAGNGTSGYAGDGASATAAEIYEPDGVAMDTAGNIYLADYSNHRIRRISAAGIITTVAGNGTLGFSGDGFAATNAKLDKPTAVAVDSAGNIFIADGDNNCIRKVDASGIITTVAGIGGSSGFSGDGFAATLATMNGPYGIAIDGAGNIYIGDYNNERIRKVDTSGIISTIAGTGTAGFSGDGFAATTAMIHLPYSVAADAAGDVYFTDRINERIRKINTTGIISTVAGNGTTGYSGDGAAATLAQLNDPVSVSVDAAGNFYISEYLNNVVRKVNTAGIITTLAGTGTPGFSGDGGFATAAKFNKAAGLVVDSYGNVIISDQDNERIRKITPSITVTGNSLLCIGETITMADSSAGGTWSCGSTAVATIGSLTGIVTGVSAGTATITYSIGSVTAVKTITLTTGAAAITGIDSVCVGHTRALADVTAGGAWSSSAPTMATVGSASGIVAGIAAGSSTISYTIADGCAAAVTFKVTPIPCTSSGVNEMQVTDNSAAIYPNPANDELTIKTADGVYNSYVITNQLGQVLIHNQITGSETKAVIKWLLPGLYFIAIKGDNGSRAEKFVKQ